MDKADVATIFVIERTVDFEALDTAVLFVVVDEADVAIDIFFVMEMIVDEIDANLEDEESLCVDEGVAIVGVFIVITTVEVALIIDV